MLTLILMVAAFVLFVLAAVGVPSSPRFDLMAGGLACVAAYFLVTLIVR